jgi:SOS-response transcriptional repressor LexA
MQKRREDRNKNREKVLALLTDFVRQHGYNPSIREIGQAVV